MSRKITIFHSPDADDAFMFYGMVKGGITYPGYTFTHDLCDIETLNHRTLAGELDVTAVSAHAYSKFQEHYSILSCGASMGGVDYGPRLVALENVDLGDGAVRRIGIPGPLTSAALALQLYLKDRGIDAELVPVHFDRMFEEIKAGVVDAGVIIHEGQLTLGREGFVMLEDLGSWWWKKTSLPLPLGVNVVRKSLGRDAMIATGTVLKQSILYAMDHRQGALEYALSYGRGLSYEDADTFVGMYVNEYTIDLGDAGRKAIELFLSEGHRAGIIGQPPQIEFIDLSAIERFR